MNCPPHRFPHRLICRVFDEPCHTHDNKYRREFHNIHCILLRCKNRLYRNVLKRFFKKIKSGYHGKNE